VRLAVIAVPVELESVAGPIDALTAMAGAKIRAARGTHAVHHTLSTRERAAIALRHVADLPMRDIATAMGIAPGTVGSTLHNARQYLAALMGDDEDGPAIELEVREALPQHRAG
jgi:DNA-directed RNA polymerase specialized sigma24 family protein